MSPRGQHWAVRACIARLLARHPQTNAEWRLIEDLRSLADLESPGCLWEVCESDFHGGERRSQHRSPVAALRARRSCLPCLCGGDVVRAVERDD